MSILLLFLGIALLYAGGELLVRYAVRLANTVGLSPLVIGLTVVAFGTSAPELAASLIAALRGSEEIALGNIIGSNTANIGLILGLSALVFPIRVGLRFLRREVPVMVAVGALLFVVLWDGRLGRLDASVLLLALGVYLGWLLGRSESSEAGAAEAPFVDAYRRPGGTLAVTLVGIVGGLILLVVGAQALVAGAVSIARAFGVPEGVIGLTLVAVGTSLPELASSLVAAVRREADIILGNIVGSNIFNVLAILGVVGLAQPLTVPLAGFALDLWVMLAFSLAAVALLATGLRLARLEGVVLLAGYALYVGWTFVVAG